MTWRSTRWIVIGLGLVFILVAALVLFLQQSSQMQAAALRSSAARNLGLDQSADWVEIQQALYCEVAYPGATRDALEAGLDRLGSYTVIEALSTTYRFDLPSVADHVGLIVVYDSSNRVVQRTLVEGLTIRNSDYVEKSFQCPSR